MSAFRTQLAHEWRHQRRRPFTWFCAFAYFALAFSDTVRNGWAGQGQIWINGGSEIATRAIILSVLSLLASAGVIGEAFSRDRRQRVESMVLVTGAGRWALGGGRLIVCLLVTLGASLCFIPGMILGALMPGIAPDLLGPFDWTHYLAAAGIYLVPNVLITAALVFVVAARTRNQTAAFGAAIGLVALYSTGRMLLGRDVYQHAVFERFALLDPYASIAGAEHVMGWTVSQVNTQFTPFEGLIVWNRLLWLGLAAVLYAIGLRWLPRQPAAPRIKRDRRRWLPRPSRRWPGAFLGLLRAELRALLRHPGVRLAALMLAVTLWQSAASAGTHLFSLPSTDLLTHTTGFYFDKVLVLAIVWAAGDLYWRERRVGFAPIIDALPVRDGTRLMARLSALLLMILTAWLLAIGVGLLYQRVHGYTDHELGLFVVDSFLVKAPKYLWLGGMAFALQVLIRRRLIAMIVALLIYGSPLLLEAVGVWHPMARFGEVSFFWYSLMDGYGHFWPAHWALVGWWSLTVALLLLIAWGTADRTHPPRPRWQRLRARLGRGRGRALAIVLTGAWLAWGGWVGWQSVGIGPWPPLSKDAAFAEIERRYGAIWRDREQPTVEGIQADITLDPQTRTLRSDGTLTLVNRSPEVIDEVMLLHHPLLTAQTLSLPGTRVEQVPGLGVQIWRLAKPLQPGAQIPLTFALRGAPPPGLTVLPNKFGALPVHDVEVVGNGTALLNLRLMPAVGYSDRVEHKPRWKRRRYGLPLDWTPPNPRRGRHQAHATRNLGWVRDLDVTLRTRGDQIGLHGGERISESMEDGWHVSRYRNRAPMRGWSPVVSGRYVVHRAEREGVIPVELYHDPAHAWVIEAWSDALLDALGYFKVVYGEPPMGVMRLAENAMHYDGQAARGGLARSSEIFGWKTDLRLSRGEDLHQYAARILGSLYWGSAVIPANLPGAKILHAGVPFWSADLYLHQRRPPDVGRRLRRQAMREAFRARSRMDDVELPFDQEFKNSTMLRAKGGIAILALAEAVGMERLQDALAAFRTRWQHQGPPFATAADFVGHLRAALPEASGLITDIFQRVTTWHLKVERARAWQTTDGWVVEIDVDARKRYTQPDGSEREVELQTPVTLGVLVGWDFKAQSVQAHPFPALKTGRSTVRLTVGARPVQVGIDPYLLLPDPNPDDNMRAVEILPGPPSAP